MRELKAVAERLCLGLPDGLDTSLPATDAMAVSLAAQVDSYERRLIRETLHEARGNVTAAAERLRLPKKTLYDKLTRHRLDPEAFRK